LLFYMQDGKSDDAYSRTSSDHHQIIANGQMDPTSRAFEYYWTIRLKHIGRINMYLDNIDVPYVEDENVRTEYKANLEALRAWQYFIVASRWGDIPYSEETNTLEEATLEETPYEKVMDTLFDSYPGIVDDLRKERYSSDKFRFNKDSFKALVMRYALFDERYELAATLAEEIMNNGDYELYPEYRDLFTYDGHISNDEFIIRMDADSYSGATHSFQHLGPHFRTGNGESQVVPTKALVDSYWTLQGDKIDDSPDFTKEEYELNPNLNRDPRYEASILGNGDTFGGDTIDIYDRESSFSYREERGSSSGYWYKKFVDESDAFKGDGSMEFGLLRYAEVLLTYAEAKIMMNEINDPLMKESINKITKRAGLDMNHADVTLSKYDGYDQNDWITLIRNERRVELAGEGRRYDDIIRWRIAEDVLSQPAYGDTRMENGELKSIRVENREFNPGKNYLWPHMESDLRVNPNLTQSPGY